MASGQLLKTKAVARYVLLPGVVPRLRDFSHTGFGWIAHLMAVIYSSVRLLPPGHPYLNPANVGRYGIRHVIAEAANRLVFRKENIDQFVVFFALLLGFILLVAQFAFLVLALVVKPAFALPGPFIGMFATPVPTFDIAFILLDSVFGIPNMYNSCVESMVACGPTSPAPLPFPTPFHVALHLMFQFYSLAILVIAVLILCYYVVIIVGETAQTGTPFGRRFSHIYAPLRLVIAIGLLVPINYGLNSAQYIALIAARLGSGFATNAWGVYNTALNSTVNDALGMWNGAPAPYSHSLIARPDAPDYGYVYQFLTLVGACKVAYETLWWEPPSPTGRGRNMLIMPYLVKNPNQVQPVTGPAVPPWVNALTFYNNKDIVIRFGHFDPAKYPNEPGNVKPFCGEITIHTNNLQYQGARWMQAIYYTNVTGWVLGAQVGDFGKRAACIHITPTPQQSGAPLPPYGGANCNATPFGVAGDAPGQLPPETYKQNMTNLWNLLASVNTQNAYNIMVATTPFAMTPQILGRGWAGAGIWYNKLAEWNGALFEAVFHTPTVNMMPSVMVKVEKMRATQNMSLSPEDRYDPNIRDEKAGAGSEIAWDIEGEQAIAKMLNDVYTYWRIRKSVESNEMKSGDNIFITAMNAMFGLDGLFTMRHNQSTHPMAQLAAMGKSILDSAIRNLMVGLGFAAAGGMTEILGQAALAGTVEVLSGPLLSIATIGLTIGFTLYYILPFMPFLYFFFAVGAWVKTIFEAMIGVPLWALAHLRIDGNGLPGESAMQGYFLIFEIFLRPILTLFGLIASFMIFAAAAKTLNGLFKLATENLTGFDCTGCAAGAIVLPDLEFRRAVVDEFFFTIIYAILIYMMGNACFKLIDRIPDGILRWLGAGVKSFGDSYEDPTAGVASYAAIGANQMSSQIVSAAQKGAVGLGQAGGGLAKIARDWVTPTSTTKTLSTGKGTGQAPVE